MTNKVNTVEILSQLAKLDSVELTDEFSNSTHFTALRANNDAVARAVERQLNQKSEQIAEKAASTIIELLSEVEAKIEQERAALASVRRQESILISHIQSMAVARVYATKTNNYLPLLYACRGEWDMLVIPHDQFKTILDEIKADRRKPDPESKKSLAKAAGTIAVKRIRKTPV